MAATIPVRSIRAGSYWTVARSVARFTFASATPSARDRYRSMRFTQLAQVIPTTGRVNSVGEAELVLTVPTGYYRGVCWLRPGHPRRHHRRTSFHRGRRPLAHPIGRNGWDFPPFQQEGPHRGTAIAQDGPRDGAVDGGQWPRGNAPVEREGARRRARQSAVAPYHRGRWIDPAPARGRR